jgi:putative DNA primase/helicase
MSFDALEQVAKNVKRAGDSLEVRESYTRNDNGNADRFVDANTANIRYVAKWGRWLIWNGQRWRLDETSEVLSLARQHAHEVLIAASEIKDDEKRNKAVSAAIWLGNNSKLKAMLELACSDRRVGVRHDDLDADPYLLGVKNGVVDLRTGHFLEGRREDYVTKCMGTEYIEGADCPLWREFLTVVLGGDRELIRYMQRAIGYTLSGLTREQCFFFLHGDGSNGKSTFIETLSSLLGEYSQRAPQSLVTASQNGREPTHEIARLIGARQVIGAETEDGSRWAESRLKDLTGGDTLTGRYLYQEAFDFKPVLKLWLYGNHKPQLRGTDTGIWRRVRLIPFTAQISDDRKDRELPAKLLAELPGILNWAVEGFGAWQKEGLRSPKAVTDAVAEYRQDEDVLGEFISEMLVEDPESRISRAELFDRYQSWCRTEGILYPMSANKLCKRLKQRPGFGDRDSKIQGVYYWKGFAFVDRRSDLNVRMQSVVEFTAVSGRN